MIKAKQNSYWVKWQHSVIQTKVKLATLVNCNCNKRSKTIGAVITTLTIREHNQDIRDKRVEGFGLKSYKEKRARNQLMKAKTKWDKPNVS